LCEPVRELRRLTKQRIDGHPLSDENKDKEHDASRDQKHFRTGMLRQRCLSTGDWSARASIAIVTPVRVFLGLRKKNPVSRGIGFLLR
jgi:hypothetical protein